MVYRVPKRGNGRMRIFPKGEDYPAFECVLADGLQRYAVEFFTYCLSGDGYGGRRPWGRKRLRCAIQLQGDHADDLVGGHGGHLIVRPRLPPINFRFLPFAASR